MSGSSAEEVVVATTKHLTLSANATTDVPLGFNCGRIEVLNRSGTAEVWFRCDGDDAKVGEDGCHVLPAAIGSLEVADETSGDTVVSLISPGSPTISVRGF